MSFAASARRFAAAAARARAELFPATITVEGVAGELGCAKSPTKTTRERAELGAGWIQQASATFTFPAAGDYTPDIGAQFTLVDCEIADEEDTVWSCVDINRAGITSGHDHVCRCIRLD